jgi:ribosomal peptide maturation radical SAM protein 1
MRININQIKEHVLSTVGEGDVLLIVPPFGSIDDISLGPHILQSLAQSHGFKTDILYLSILLASIIGVEEYQRISNSPNFAMLGERLFARNAYDLPPLGKHAEYCSDSAMSTRGKKGHPEIMGEVPFDFDLNKYLEIECICNRFVNDVSAIIASLNYKIIGCTVMMEQINASVALINGIKKHAPDKITIMGGGHCQEEMADGTATLSKEIDYIFSGESETTFIKFLEDHAKAKLPPRHSILKGKPCTKLDQLPVPDYQFFFNQYKQFCGHEAPEKVKIWYETSRGCWWSDILKCRYCGILHFAYRQKSIPKVLEDLKHIGAANPGKIIYMIDSVMPRSFHDELLPILIDDNSYPPLGYQVRAELGLKEVARLKQANINAILPGIESFATGLLNLMHKGVAGKQNLFFMRNALSADIYSDWFMLSQFPGDKISDYQQLIELLPLIRHLQPPRRCGKVLLMRFSPYFDNQEKYHISNIKPWAVMDMTFPDWADKEKISTYFSSDYPSEAHEHPEIIKELMAQVELWKKTWRKTTLTMKPFMDVFVIYDNRDIHKKSRTHILDEQQAAEIMTSRRYKETPNLKWAIQEKLAVVMDSWYVPLVTAPIDMLLKFEELKNEKQTSTQT